MAVATAALSPEQRARLHELLDGVYTADAAEDLTRRIAARLDGATARANTGPAWSAADVVLITYADAISNEGEAPLRSLRTFLSTHLDGLIGQVHLLPFFPFTSDDGFAVSDYRHVDPQHGVWADVRALSEDVDLVFDLVINHASSAHRLFQDFLENTSPGNQFFMTADPSVDVSGVTRPRATRLLQEYETQDGPRHVWCTFSRDQVDWDFSNPEVLYEFVDVVVEYIEHGASWLRVDAIAYLWKELGTSCVHLPQTHAIVKVLRLVAEALDPNFKILTETNVPLAENLSYFGDGDEANIVYNFSLPPLLLHALVTEDTRVLTEWCSSLPQLPEGCTFLNFVASHDGIGLRPAEGLLDAEQLDELIHCVELFGGRLTQRARPDGSLSPYEANIALFDACQGTVEGEDAWQVERFLASQGLMLSLAGVPALYYNSLLAAPNDYAGLAETGRNRTINRTKWSSEQINARLSNPEGAPARVLTTLSAMLRVRQAQNAFHPEARQQCISVDPRVFVVWRTCPKTGQRVLCINNLSRSPITLSAAALQLPAAAKANILFNSGDVSLEDETVSLAPYTVSWIEVQPDGEGSP